MNKKKIFAFLAVGVSIIAVICFLFIRSGDRRNHEPTPSAVTEETPNASFDPAMYPTPAPTTGPFINVPRPTNTEDVFTDYEYTGSNYEKDAVYVNDQILPMIYQADGSTISVGLGEASVSDGLYLNLHESSGKKMGYYISSSRNDVLFNPTLEYSPLDSEQNASYSNFLIDRTYDQLVPAEGENLCWANDILYDGKTNAGTTLNVRAINLSTGALESTFKIEIGFENDTYLIKSISSTDSVLTGDMTQEDHDAIVTHALALAQNQFLDLSPSAISELGGRDLESYLIHSKVEKVDSPYFNRVLTPPSGRMALSYRFAERYSDIYAVTLSAGEGDSFTLYYAADVNDSLEELLQEDLADLFPDGVPEDVEIPDLSPVTSKELRFFAYDLFAPTSTSVPAPSGYFN